jgi:hypothetical protein
LLNFIPQAVWKEVVETGIGRFGAEQVAKASWLTILPVSNIALVSFSAFLSIYPT